MNENMNTTMQPSADMAPALVPSQQSNGSICPFENFDSFSNAWRMSKCLSSSSIVPGAFRGPDGQPNCMIALELASRLHTSIFMIMQHLYIVSGKPAFSSQFIIAAIQACGRYSPLKYKKRFDGNGRLIGCRAYAKELKSGEVLEGPEVTMEMAEKEGWIRKNGSKWQTMPEVMMTYRAAAFFGRIYAPDLMMGFKTEDEAIETSEERAAEADTIARLNRMSEKAKPIDAVPAEEVPAEPLAEKGEVPTEKPQPVAQEEPDLYKPNQAQSLQDRFDERQKEAAPQPRSYRPEMEQEAIPAELMSDENGNV